MTNRNDIIGQELEVGDRVIYVPPYYKKLSLGVILKRSEKTVTVKKLSDVNGRNECRRSADEVFKVDDQLETVPELLL